jgi:hypothetical protein
MQQRYRNVFGTPEGRVVLGDILTLGHFGETLNPEDTVRVVEYSFALIIARMAGALDLVYKQLGIPVREEK